MEAEGTARAAAEIVDARTADAGGGAGAAHFWLRHPAAVIFGRRALRGHLRVDGSGLGTQLAAAQCVSLSSFCLFNSADGASEFHPVPAAAVRVLAGRNGRALYRHRHHPAGHAVD